MSSIYGFDYPFDNKSYPPLRPDTKVVSLEEGKKESEEETEVKAVAEEENNDGSCWTQTRSPGTKKKKEEEQKTNRVNVIKQMQKAAAKERMDALVAKKKKKQNKDSKACKYCNHNPCCLDKHYDELMEIGESMEEESNNREIRHALYREMANRLWGRIGRGNRRELPKCVIAEIHDAYPKNKGEVYVGFKPYDSFKVTMKQEMTDEENSE
jgi:hypothetical protein